MSSRNNNNLELVNVLLQHTTANNVFDFLTLKTMCTLLLKWYNSHHKVLTFIWYDSGNMVLVKGFTKKASPGKSGVKQSSRNHNPTHFYINNLFAQKT